MPDKDRFFSKVRKDEESGCWIWIGGKFNSGYGAFNINRIPKLAHRVSWEMKNGPIPDGLCVLHNCPSGDNPLCVNPDHLYLGTDKDNTSDAIAKGQFPRTVLSLAQAKEVRDVYSTGLLTYRDIATHYGVSESYIKRIITGETDGRAEVV